MQSAACGQSTDVAAMLGDVLHPVVAWQKKITVVLTDGGDQIYAIVEFAAAEKN